MNKKAFFFVILAGVLWGTSGIFVKSLSVYGFDTWQLTAVRGLGSVLLLAAVLLIRDPSLFRVKLGELVLYVFLGAALFGTSAFYFASLQMTSISTAVVLMYTAPVLVMIFSVAFLGEKMSLMKGVAVALMLLGCALVSGVVGGLRFQPVGLFFGLLSGLSYATYNVLAKVAMSKGYRPLTTTFYTFVFMSAVAFCAARPWELPRILGGIPFYVYGLILLMGLVTAVGPYFCYNLAMKHLPAGTTASLAIVEPMAATVFGVVIYRESLTVFSLVGIVMILAAIFLLGFTERVSSRSRKTNG